ncbi:MAG: hypothetical protein IT377_33735 [Polyangiaceae bacterium]|nr:hypothetical protein [Myxococcales bacterium]MCC6903978.1 hypothetical protein [Polyangiaceae bacterium]
MPERLAAGLSLALVALASVSRAEEPADPLPAALAPAGGGYLHLTGALSVGRGLRFNNPYRLATPLGEDAESLSLGATYLDLALGAAAGDPDGWQHGGSLHFSVAAQGIPQEVVTPSYLLMHRLPPRYWLFARAGLPVVLGPDPNLGFELALGGSLMVSAGLGVTGELVGDVFYGAATQDQAYSVIPMLSLQVGVVVDLEVLP